VSASVFDGSGWVSEDRSVVGCELLALPKAELHLHLHGATRRATVAELSAATGLTVADRTTRADRQRNPTHRRLARRASRRRTGRRLNEQHE
jgi:hypothetical protein